MSASTLPNVPWAQKLTQGLPKDGQKERAETKKSLRKVLGGGLQDGKRFGGQTFNGKEIGCREAGQSATRARKQEGSRRK